MPLAENPSVSDILARILTHVRAAGILVEGSGVVSGSVIDTGDPRWVFTRPEGWELTLTSHSDASRVQRLEVGARRGSSSAIRLLWFRVPRRGAQADAMVLTGFVKALSGLEKTCQ